MEHQEHGHDDENGKDDVRGREENHSPLALRSIWRKISRVNTRNMTWLFASVTFNDACKSTHICSAKGPRLGGGFGMSASSSGDRVSVMEKNPVLCAERSDEFEKVGHFFFG